MSADPRRPIVVVTGVTGVGKTTVGEKLAACLSEPYRDADSFHSPANVAKMSAGRPLDDADRQPWLDAIRAWCQEAYLTGTGGVVSCSALKRAYRDRLRDGSAELWFLHLTGSVEVLRARLDSRVGHFMPPGLLDSQLDTLEPLEPDEWGAAVDVDRPVDEIVDVALDALAAFRATTHDPPPTE